MVCAMYKYNNILDKDYTIENDSIDSDFSDPDVVGDVLKIIYMTIFVLPFFVVLYFIYGIYETLFKK